MPRTLSQAEEGLYPEAEENTERAGAHGKNGELTRASDLLQLRSSPLTPAVRRSRRCRPSEDLFSFFTDAIMRLEDAGEHSEESTSERS
jgi:hypothetical protein